MTVKELRKKLGELVDADKTVASLEVVIDFNGIEDLIDVEVKELNILTKKPGEVKATAVPVSRVVLSA